MKTVYAMTMDELEAMLDRVAPDGWEWSRVESWVELWEIPKVMALDDETGQSAIMKALP